MNNNFFYFALNYLDDWFLFDRKFIRLLKSNQRNQQLSGIQEATRYYRIRRNFHNIREEERLSGALNILQSINIKVTQNNVDEVVLSLSNSFRELYGRNTISAASKLLWLKYNKSPIRLYDSRAAAYLRLQDYIFNNSDYETYRMVWNECYENYKTEIANACKYLYKVKRYSLSSRLSDNTIKTLSNSRWFQERVFDKYLWTNGIDA